MTISYEPTKDAARKGVRADIGHFIAAELDERFDARIWLTDEVTGPLGGVSCSVTGVIDHPDYGPVCVSLSIYSDHNIDQKVEGLIDAESKNSKKFKNFFKPDPALEGDSPRW